MRSGSEIADGGALPGRDELVSDEIAAQPLESQQAIVLGALRDAAGAPVSYEQLRQAGIEFPASIAAELELAGVDIERCHLDGEERPDGSRSREPGLRLLPTPAEEASTIVLEPPHTAPIAQLASGRLGKVRLGRRRVVPGAVDAGSADGTPATRAPRADTRARFLVAVAALAVLAALLAILLSNGGSTPPSQRTLSTGSTSHTRAPAGDAQPGSSGGGSRTHAAKPSQTGGAPSHPSRHESAGAVRAESSPPAGGGTQAPSTRANASSTRVSAALAAQYESEGHSLLEGGRAQEAIPVLSKAVAATGEQQTRCLEPASEACLTYAYALYDLGRALVESGDAPAAIPVLERRLQIDNQRPVVEEELAAARAGVG